MFLISDTADERKSIISYREQSPAIESLCCSVEPSDGVRKLHRDDDNDCGYTE